MHKVGLMEAEIDAISIYHKGGIPCVIYGPGELIYAHSSQEQIILVDIAKAAETILHLIRQT